MYEYNAVIDSIYDGDGSFGSVVDLGMGIYLHKKIRLFGVDTPEMRGEQHDAGQVVRDFVRKLALGKKVVIKTQKDATGKYGRLLAEISIEYNGEHIDLSELLVQQGFAKRYYGGKKELWTPQELLLISERAENV